MSKIWGAVLFLLILLTLSTSSVRAETPSEISVSICDDGAEWPPYTYYDRATTGKTQKIIGYSVDVIKTIFEKHGIKSTIELLPWKRCLVEVERGNKHQMLLSASYNEERAKKYHISKGYYSLNNVYFYSAKKYPNGLTIKGVEDIRLNYKPCGIYGYSYSSIGFEPGEIDQAAKGYQQLIEILHKRGERCDLFVEGYEIFSGFSAIGKNYFSDPNLKHGAIPGLEPKHYHMLISRRFKNGAMLKHLIDTEIEELEASGKLAILLKKYDLIDESKSN